MSKIEITNPPNTGVAGSMEHGTSSLKDRLTFVSILLISLAGSFVILYSTKWGPWVFSDSTEYIVSARNLLAGHGLGLYGPSGAFHPLYFRPPFYSLILGFFGFIGADLVNTARWINVVLFGLTILLTGLSLYSFTHSSWLSITTGIFLFSMPALIDIYSGAMSEPLFIFTGLTSLVLILSFLRNNRYAVLLAAAFASGLSLFSRFIGLAFIITGLVSLFVFSYRSWKNRILDIIIFGLVSILPTASWLAWLKFQSMSIRSTRLDANLWQSLTQMKLKLMELFWSWLPFSSIWPRYSYNLARNLLIIAIFLILILLILTVWKMGRNNIKIFNSNHGLFPAGIMLMFVMAYLIVLAFSYVYTYPPPALNSRILLPVQMAVFIGFFSLVLFFIRAWPSIKWLSMIPILLAIGISFSYLQDDLDYVLSHHQNGAGYTSRDWRASGTIQAVEQLPSKITIISNESAAVLFYTGRPAFDIVELIYHKPLTITTRYGDDPADPAQKAFRENGAALVLFNTSFWQFRQLYGNQTTQRLEYFTQGLFLYAQLGDGAIYFYNPTGK
jgi:hypothetical protein